MAVFPSLGKYELRRINCGGGGANLETTVGVLIACAAEQEAARDGLLSICGIGNVLRLVGQVWELMVETL